MNNNHFPDIRRMVKQEKTMEIKGCVHCFFEQSGTFKREFKKLGYEAYDYDIQNNYGETDYQIDLFAEIEKAYEGGASVFDNIIKDDLILAFFPCIYFECLSMMAFSWTYKNYKKLTRADATKKIIEREGNRHRFYLLLLKLVAVIEDKGLRMIFENPWAMQHFFKQGNFVKNPDIIDMDRTRRGDGFVKPTAYWFFGCEPTHGTTMQRGERREKDVMHSKKGKHAGLCSEERSMISPDYARNFIHDFILGKSQPNICKTLFD